ncbi:unnamed protein product [Victoria cruziana]
MARQPCFLPILFVAVLLAFAQVESARVYEEKQNKELPESGKVPAVANPHGDAHMVPQPAGGKGDAHEDLINCITCPIFIHRFCCGIFCCSEEQYKEYIKLQALPKN